MVGLMLVAVFLAVNPMPAQAQLLWVNGTLQGIELLWTPPADLPLPWRYTIRRSPSQSGRWIVIASTERTIADDSVFYAFVASTRQSHDLHQAVHEQILAALFDHPRAVASALGTYFHDTTTAPLGEYDYQIWAGSLLIATVSGVISHQRKVPPPPSYGGVRQRDRCVELWWQTDSVLEHGIVGYVLYRERYPESPIRLLQQPIKSNMLRSDTTIGCYVRDCSVDGGDSVVYYIAALDVFNNEGQAALITYRLAPPIGSQPHTAVGSITTTLQVELDKSSPARQQRRLLARTSSARQWRWLECIWRDSLATFAFPCDSADAIAITCIAGDGTHHSWTSVPIILPLQDTLAPDRPAFCDVERYGEQTLIRWTGATETDVTGYLLERATDKDTLQLFVAEPVHSFLDTTIATAQYRISTIDAHGNTSAPSPWAEAIRYHSSRPELLTVSLDGNGVLLRWNNPPGTAHVLVNRYDDTMATPITIAQLEGAVTSFVDREPTASGVWYQIVTLDTAGRYSMPSERRRIGKQTHCKVPPFDSAVSRDGNIILYWSKDWNGELLLERIATPSDDVVVLAKLTEGDSMFADDTAESGKTYTYRLRCIGSSLQQLTSTITISIPP